MTEASPFLADFVKDGLDIYAFLAKVYSFPFDFLR